MDYKPVMPPRALIALNGTENLVTLQDGKQFLKSGYNYTPTTDFPELPVQDGSWDIVQSGSTITFQDSTAYDSLGGVEYYGGYVYRVGSYGATDYSRLYRFSTTGTLISYTTIDWTGGGPSNEAAQSLCRIGSFWWISNQYDIIVQFNVSGSRTGLSYTDNDNDIADICEGHDGNLVAVGIRFNNTAAIRIINPTTGGLISTKFVSSITNPQGICYNASRGVYIVTDASLTMHVLNTAFQVLYTEYIGARGRLAEYGSVNLLAWQSAGDFWNAYQTSSFVGNDLLQHGNATLYLSASGSAPLQQGEERAIGGVSVNAMAMVNSTDNVFTNKQGSVYLKTGIIETDVGKYPDAIVTPGTPDYVGLADPVTDPGGNVLYIRVK